jgi:G:T-mismatch repair DNA endonuclease (very short patch repair protein)
MDRLSTKDRSYQMSLVKSKNTVPELAVRKLVFSMGHRKAGLGVFAQEKSHIRAWMFLASAR